MKRFHRFTLSEGGICFQSLGLFGPPCVKTLRDIKVKTKYQKVVCEHKTQSFIHKSLIKYGSKLFKDGTCTETSSKRFNGADFRNRTAYVLLRKSVEMSESSKSNKRLASNCEANQTSVSGNL